MKSFFYEYKNIVQTLSVQSHGNKNIRLALSNKSQENSISQTLSAKSSQRLNIRQTPSGKSSKNIVQTLSALSSINNLSALFPLPWSHYVRLLTVKNEDARKFYETEALRNGWSVRQLDRQISTQFDERTIVLPFIPMVWDGSGLFFVSSLSASGGIFYVFSIFNF